MVEWGPHLRNRNRGLVFEQLSVSLRILKNPIKIRTFDAILSAKNCGTDVKYLQSSDEKIRESWNSLQILGRMKESSCLKEWPKLL